MKNTDKNTTNMKKDVTNVVTNPTWKVLDVLPVDIDANTAVRQDTIVIYVSERNKKVHTRKIQETQRHTNYKVEGYSTEDSLYKQEDTDDSESKDSFCLQMQIMKLQADQESCDTQHLATNLHYKVKPYGKKTKLL